MVGRHESVIPVQWDLRASESAELRAPDFWKSGLDLFCNFVIRPSGILTLRNSLTQSSGVSEFRNSGISEIWSSGALKSCVRELRSGILLYFRSSGVPESRNSMCRPFWSYGILSSGVLEFRGPGVTECRNPGVPEFRNPEAWSSGNMEFRSPGPLGIWTSGDVQYRGATFLPVCVSIILGFVSSQVPHLYISGPLDFCGPLWNLGFWMPRAHESWRSGELEFRVTAPIQNLVRTGYLNGGLYPLCKRRFARGDFSAYCMSCCRGRACAKANYGNAHEDYSRRFLGAAS